MSSVGTTSLASLPTSNDNADPVQLVARDVANELKMAAPTYSADVDAPKQRHGGMLPDQNKMVRAIEGPASKGLTSFPDKHLHIPPAMRQTDNQPRQETIPTPPLHRDYIGDEPERRPERMEVRDTNDAFKLPILAACLFFLFNTPIVRRAARSVMPIAPSSQGSYNLQAQLMMGLLFGVAVYGVSEVITWT